MLNYRKLDDARLDFVAVATVGELGDGDRIVLDIGGVAVAVFNIGGQYFAIGDVCSHDEGPLAEGNVDGQSIECPRHGAKFDLASGKALTLPAVVDIPAYPVRVVGEEIQVGLPTDM